MKFAALVALFIILMTMPASATSYDWVTNPANGHNYTLVDAISWADAENQAVALGGHLITIRNVNENDWLEPWLSSVTGPTQWWAWTGLYQLPNSPESAGGWVWISGEPVTYTNWSNGEPNDYYGSGDPENWCGYYIRVQAPDREFPEHWLDVRNEPSLGIVEVSQEPIPEPATILLFGIGLIVLIAYRMTRQKRK